MTDLVERLREEARQEEATHKMLADAKTARQTDRDDAWTDAGYQWLRAEQTSRWQAASTIEALSERIAVLEGLIRECRLADAYVCRTGDEGRWDRAFHDLCRAERRKSLTQEPQ